MVVVRGRTVLPGLALRHFVAAAQLPPPHHHAVSDRVGLLGANGIPGVAYWSAVQ